MLIEVFGNFLRTGGLVGSACQQISSMTAPWVTTTTRAHLLKPNTRQLQLIWGGLQIYIAAKVMHAPCAGFDKEYKKLCGLLLVAHPLCLSAIAFKQGTQRSES